ncbi:MAG: efflux RND transporter periplasmic adaptor subunit [Planctomycetes bacterium]|nr:efflux RND transporter periplasmic adaptor subunit [Planctomycetota bacterium]
MRLGLFLLFTGVGLLAGCSHPKSEPAAAAQTPAAPKPVAVTVAPVSVRPVQRTVEVVGTFRGMEEVTVGSKSAGRVVRVHHDVGDVVKPGDLLLEIDDTDYRLAVEEASRQLDSELAKLGLSKLPSQDASVNELPTVIRARLLADNALRRFQRSESLFQRKVITDDEFETAKTDYQVAEADFQQAVIDARTILSSARHRNATLLTTMQKLQDTRIVVPTPSEAVAGSQFVVARRMVSAGEMAQSSPPTEVFKLVMDNPLKLKATVPERHIGEVQQNLAAQIAVDAYPGQKFSGHVSRISPTVDSVNRTFEIEMLVPNPKGQLRPGSFAKAWVLVSQSAQALTVPQDALVTFAGVQKVFVVRGERAVPIEVQLGVRGEGWLEVFGALDPNDQVVTSGYTQLAEGTAVRIRTVETAEASSPASR